MSQSLGVALLAGILAACSSAADPGAGTSSPTATTRAMSSTSSTSTVRPAPKPVVIPQTAVGRQLTWVTRQLERPDESGRPVSTQSCRRTLGSPCPKQVSCAAFKGGSTPGVMTLSWYVESPAGPRVLVVMVRSTDPAKTADATRIAGIAERGLELLVS